MRGTYIIISAGRFVLEALAFVIGRHDEKYVSERKEREKEW